ncbi:MAG: hypothetical protein V1870_05810 [Candidatus Aenigmatarchaeota archaeon]
MKLYKYISLFLLAGYLLFSSSSGCNKQPDPIRKVYSISGTVNREKIESDGFYRFTAKTPYGDREFFFKGNGYELDKRLNPGDKFAVEIPNQDPISNKELLIGPSDITKIEKTSHK